MAVDHDGKTGTDSEGVSGARAVKRAVSVRQVKRAGEQAVGSLSLQFSSVQVWGPQFGSPQYLELWEHELSGLCL